MFNKKICQGPNGFIAPMCEVHMQYGNSSTKLRSYTSFDLIPLYPMSFDEMSQLRFCPLKYLSIF